MGEAPPLDELAARKRLVQAKMELHRAEIALYYHHIMAPLKTAQSGISTASNFLSHPAARMALVGGLGVLLFSGRLKFFRKPAGLIIPFISSRLRGFLFRRAWDLVLKRFQVFDF